MSAKVYPVLLLIPIVAGRRWRLLAWTVAALALLVAVAPNLWASYLTNRILQRSSAFLLAENSSLANTFYFIGIQLSRLPIGALARDLHIQLRSFALVFYAGLLLATALFDFLAARSASPKDYYASLAMYFPFMVAVPQLAYHYELVVLIALVPVVCYLWQEATTRVQRTLLGAIVVGIILSQVQAVALKKLTGSLDPHYIPGFGLLIVILAITGLKFHNLVLRYPSLGRHLPRHRN